jgi:imidazolonepropionase-like amidohydrolase
VSPDGSRVAFTALGDLWTMPLGGAPERLTDDLWVEVDPMWSPDGTRLAYASDRGGDGEVDIWIHDVSSDRVTRLTTGGGSGPVWSPDGREVAYTGGGGPDGGLRVVDVATGSARTVRSGLNSPGRPSWSPDGRSIAVSAHDPYSSRFREGVNRALLIPVPRPAADEAGDAVGSPRTRPAADGDAEPFPGWNGPVAGLAGDASAPPMPQQAGERWLDFPLHVSIGSRGKDGPIWSPDGEWMAYVSAGVLWAIPVSGSGDPVGPPRRLTNETSAEPTWTADSQSIVYQTDDELRRVWLHSGRIDPIPVDLTWRREVPDGRYVIHAGSVFDGVSDRLRPNVDVVVESNRIVRVADHAASLHTGTVVDASDGVLTPGFIEMHTHGGLGEGEAGGRVWLSYGVTSIRRAVADPYDVTEAKEAVESGRRTGPRIFGTGNSIDGSRIYYAGAPSLASTAQVELEMEQAEALGYDMIKTYVRLPDAVQARVIADAHDIGLHVTSHELYPAVAYGVDGVEHVRGTSRRGYSTKVSELHRSYQDVEELLVRSGMSITPTVGLYGGFGVLQHDVPSLLEDPRIEAFAPSTGRGGARGGDVEATRRMISDMADLARRVVERGGVVVAGTDYGPSGMTLLAEIEILVRYGGLTPADALRAATSVPAEAMGYGAELGRVAEGMLADLVVLGGDPLSDIGAVRDTRIVIANGRVYEMEELLRRPVTD